MNHQTDDDSDFSRAGDDMADDLETHSHVPTSSEIRFDSLPDREGAVHAIVAATRALGNSNGVLVNVPAASDTVPDLKRDAGFRYTDQYQPFIDALHNGEAVTIVIVQKDGDVIAFGLGEVPSKHGVEIMTTDVEEASRRSAGVKSSIDISNEPFEIGIGHVLVLGLIESIDASVLHTNATSPQARYIFKSLGFVSSDEDNSCLLRLQKK